MTSPAKPDPRHRPGDCRRGRLLGLPQCGWETEPATFAPVIITNHIFGLSTLCGVLRRPRMGAASSIGESCQRLGRDLQTRQGLQDLYLSYGDIPPSSGVGHETGRTRNKGHIAWRGELTGQKLRLP